MTQNPMNTHILKQLSIIKFSATLATCGLGLGMFAPAQAAVIAPGDYLTVAANQIVTQGNLTGNVDQLYFDFLPRGGPSGFTVVQTGSQGFFEDYAAGEAGNCQQTNGNCTIKDGYLTGSIADFLKYDDATGSLDDWTLSLSNITVTGDTTTIRSRQQYRQITFEAEGIFKNLTTGQSIGTLPPVGFEVGFFVTGANRGRGNFQLVAQPVPEPLTMLGVGTAVAFGVTFKRKLASKK